MLKASTARVTGPRRTPRPGRALLTGCAAVVLLAGVSPATAQQYGRVGSSVTVDYGVLDGIGADPNLPALLGGTLPPQMPSVTSAYPGAYPPSGLLLAPPVAAPRSTLTVQGPGGPSGAIKLIPPSEFKKKKAPVSTPPAPQPKPEVSPTPPTQQAAADPVPPPPPTTIEPVATPIVPASAPAVAVPAPVASAPEEPAPAAQPADPAPQPDTAAAPAASAPGTGTTESPAVAATESGTDEPAQAETEQAADPEAAAASEPEPAGEAAVSSDPASEASEPVTAGEEPGDTQTASLPTTAEGQVSVAFAEGSSDLSPEAVSTLDAMADKLRDDQSLRIQLLAYARATDDNTSRARRTSLSRALAVRSYLIEKGVTSTRMDVRALGNNVENEPADRVDIIPQVQ